MNYSNTEENDESVQITRKLIRRTKESYY